MEITTILIFLLSPVSVATLDEAEKIWEILFSCGEGKWWMREPMERKGGPGINWVCSNVNDTSPTVQSMAPPPNWPNPAYWPKDYRPEVLKPLKRNLVLGECLQVNWDPVCFDHLLCYSTCGRTREECDQEFRQSMMKWCRVHKGGLLQKHCKAYCEFLAFSNYRIVEIFGTGYYPERQKRCKCHIAPKQEEEPWDC